MGGEGMALRPADARPGFHRPDPPGFPRGGAAAAGAGQQALQRLGVAFPAQEAGQHRRFPVLERVQALVAAAEVIGVGETDTTTRCRHAISSAASPTPAAAAASPPATTAAPASGTAPPPAPPGSCSPPAGW